MLKVLILFVLLSGVSWLAAETPAKTANKITSQAATSKPLSIKPLSIKALPIMRGVGGDFTAVGVDGKPFQLNRYHDKIVLLFFGYTNCADICPFTLGYLKRLYEKLTPAEQNVVQIVFVSVDPEYDTPGHLRKYIHFFNKDFTAVTGTRAQIDEIVKQYQATYNKISGNSKVKTKEMRRVNQKAVADKDKDAAYVYSHSINIYVMDGKLRVRSLRYAGSKQAEFLQIIRQLIAEQSAKQPKRPADNGKQTDKQAVTKTPVVKKAVITKKTAEKTTAETTAKTTKKGTVKLPVLLNYWVHLGPPNTRVMAAYGDFINTGDKDIYLVGVENSDFDHVELHESVIEGDVAKMLEHSEFLIPAGGTLQFAVNKRHMMLVTPFKRFKHNGETTMTLRYRVAGFDDIFTQTVVFPVSFNGEGCSAMPLN